MGLTQNQRNIIMGILADFHSERIIDQACDIIYEGFSCKGLISFTDQELLEDYKWVRGFEDDEEAKNNKFYQECLAELGMDEAINDASS